MSSQKIGFMLQTYWTQKEKVSILQLTHVSWPLVTFVSHVLGRGGTGCVSNKRIVHPASLISDQVHLCIGTTALFISV